MVIGTRSIKMNVFDGDVLNDLTKGVVGDNYNGKFRAGIWS
jgi:hypothetical protein